MTNNRITSVPHLLAVAHGHDCVGPHRCFYCGAPCGEKHPASEFVQSSFTGRTGVVAPGSLWICEGCVLALRERCELDMITGERRHVNAGAMRAFSWVITRESAVAASKAHIAELRALCLRPPDPPYALVLSDSGKTHQIYRGVVNHDRWPVTLTLEGEPITYQPRDLTSTLEITGRVAAAAGKPSLSEPPGMSITRHLMERYRDGETIAAAWDRLWSTPLGRLAAWLTPRKDLCEHEYPADAITPSA